MSLRLTLSALLVAALPAVAQEAGHSGHGAHAAGPAAAAFDEINGRMHDAMAVEWSGDADVDFIRAMIPHHQGAVEMAKVVLEHGDDPEVKKLAEAIIAAQEAEIAWMQAWLAAHGG